MNAKDYLGFESMDRASVRRLLEISWGKKLHPKTLYRWMDKLSISNSAVIDADKIQDLLIYIWLCQKGLRNIALTDIKQITEQFQNEFPRTTNQADEDRNEDHTSETDKTIEVSVVRD